MIARRRRALLACLAMTVGLLAGCETTTRMNATFPVRRAAFKRVAVAPPDVAIVRRTFQGDTRSLHQDEDAVRATLPGLIAAELRGRGFEIKDAALDERHFKENPDLRFETTQLQGAFLRAQLDLYETELQRTSVANHTEETIGPLVNRFADHADVDAMAVCTLFGLKKSWGETLKDVVVSLGGTVRKGAVLRVALVDGDTGEILWANSVVTEGEEFQGKGLDKMVKSAFRHFPK